MKGKIGLVVGLGVGYVLGSRAGRERYEQIKKQWLKLWHLDPVQTQVNRVQEFAKAQALAIPGAVWNGAVKVVKAASDSSAAGQRLETAASAAKDAAEDVADVAEDAAAEAKKTADAKTAAATRSATPKKSTSTRKTSTSTSKKSGS